MNHIKAQLIFFERRFFCRCCCHRLYSSLLQNAFSWFYCFFSFSSMQTVQFSMESPTQFIRLFIKLRRFIDIVAINVVFIINCATSICYNIILHKINLRLLPILFRPHPTQTPHTLLRVFHLIRFNLDPNQTALNCFILLMWKFIFQIIIFAWAKR